MDKPLERSSKFKAWLPVLGLVVVGSIYGSSVLWGWTFTDLWDRILSGWRQRPSFRAILEIVTWW